MHNPQKSRDSFLQDSDTIAIVWATLECYLQLIIKTHESGPRECTHNFRSLNTGDLGRSVSTCGSTVLFIDILDGTFEFSVIKNNDFSTSLIPRIFKLGTLFHLYAVMAPGFGATDSYKIFLTFVRICLLFGTIRVCTRHTSAVATPLSMRIAMILKSAMPFSLAF